MSDHTRNNVLSKFFELIPRVFCISYFSNHERRAKIQSLWNELGIEDKVEYMYGFPDNKKYKCSCKVIQDHVSVFKKAYREGWPFVFVFEDDAMLHENMMQIELDEIQKFLEVGKDGRGWSALTLGYDPRHFFLYNSWNEPGKNEKNILFRMNGLFSHSYLISREGMERFLLSRREVLHPLHIGVIDSFFLVDDGVYGLTHNVFGQLGFDMKQEFDPINSYIFWFFNLIWWNRLENVGLLFMVLILFLVRKMKI